ncbi:hypothetical protein B0H21DRAFT_276431 [Amylocystis lapponica]|nr:hypothetical protein B0H21DRAFT_276431 [Amylocystis lapponica]
MAARRPPSRSCSSSPSTSRRVHGQPKSSRQQYSACGACRMRRVRCDLKDLPISASGQHPPCSNCSERGLKCVDEFAEVKAVKLLRRGRRLQQVEAVYGQNASEESSLHSVPVPRSVIPQLRPEFFSSPFFRRFHIQRPIVEPLEYCPRYFDFVKGNRDTLDPAGQLISLLFVVWAASFGVNEYGVEETHEGPDSLRHRKERVKEMLQEVLYLIDVHGILRKPSWDGVRALLLVLPLTQEAQSPVERMVTSVSSWTPLEDLPWIPCQALYESTLSQVYTLCSLAPVSSVNSGQGEYVDALVRARVFWYAHVLDGATSGLRGGRVLLSDDDLSSFEATLPPLPPLGESAGASYAFAYRFATIPIRIASACRQVHTALTGPKARQCNDIDEERLFSTWDIFDQCWKDFEGLRQFGTHNFIQAEDIERFIDSWQIFIFECHNVIREALKQRLVDRRSSESFLSNPGAVHMREYETIVRLHAKASQRCHTVVRHVVQVLRRSIGTPLFQYDASLLRDGTFFAGFLLAGESENREDIEACLHALGEMRWAFSKSEEREQTVRMVWESRATQPRSDSRSFSSSPADDLLGTTSFPDLAYPKRALARPLSVPPLSLSIGGMGSTLSTASAPSTACSSDGQWSTPPTSSGTGSYGGSVTSHQSSPSTTSRSPTYLQPPGSSGLSVDALRSKQNLISSSPLLLENPGLSVGQTGRASDPGCTDGVFYFTPYSFIGMNGAGEVGHGSQSPLTVAPNPDSSSAFPSQPFFDPSTVVFSSAGIGQQGAGPGEVSAGTAATAVDRQFSGGFYQ